MLSLLLTSILILGSWTNADRSGENMLSDTVYIQSGDSISLESKFKSFRKNRNKESDNFKVLVADYDSSYFSFIDGYFLKSQILVGKRVVGAIRYHVTLTNNNGKVILLLDNPTFLPYSKNRFGKMEPDYGREMSLSMLESSRMNTDLIDEIKDSYNITSVEYLEKVKAMILGG
ncbi:hypothetical protein [Marinigracilibium pacificum]|uniref:Uncharacterized protein n=1 Tax=Marinigracilibium pacificum TaxID=2729599 RepID=A0A848IS42_9BACT|nr:hypothetical protein [Marinigracilibium pacificum]NMM47273.1 hypothetical protein [Marinigracilibium pacificum]